MGIMAVMLGVALGSTGYLNSFLGPSFPAWCLFHPSRMHASGAFASPNNTVYVAVAAAFLIVSYLTRMIQLFSATLNEIHTTLRTRPGSFLKGKLVALKESRYLIFRSLLVFFSTGIFFI